MKNSTYFHIKDAIWEACQGLLRKSNLLVSTTQSDGYTFPDAFAWYFSWLRGENVCYHQVETGSIHSRTDSGSGGGGSDVIAVESG